MSNPAPRHRSPAIDTSGIEDPAVRRALEAIAERLEVGDGNRPNSRTLDRFVRVRDLVDTGIATVVGVISRSGPGFEYANPVVIDRTPPPAPTGLTVQGAMANILMSWDDYSDNYSHTEIWRAAVDDIGQATLTGTSIAPTYADEVGDGGRFYYWIRFVSAAGIEGPFNATAGTYGETSYDPGYLLSMLTVKWQANTAYSSGSYVIPSPAKETGLWYKATASGTSDSSEPAWPETLGETVTDGTVTWEAVEAADEYPPFIVGEVGSVPVVVMNTAYIGDASIENAKIADLAADKILAGQIDVALTLTAASIVGGDLNINDKFTVDSNGNTVIKSASSGARLDIRNNVIKVFDSAGVKRVQIGDLSA